MAPDEAMDMVEKLLDEIGEEMTNWEHDFLESMKRKCQWTENDLSEKQAETLTKIYEKHVA